MNVRRKRWKDSFRYGAVVAGGQAVYIGSPVSPEDSSYLRSDSVVDLSLQSLLNSTG